VLDADGRVTGDLHPAGENASASDLPTGVALSSSGDLYVADSRGGVIYRLPPPR
jgi:hypothetical protein